VVAGAVGVVVTAAGCTGVATGVTSAPQPTCQQGSNGVLFVTPGCQDPALTQPYTDVDEQRTTTDPATHVTVTYRYVHGGFAGTNARFSFYFPPKAQYRGRFFEPTYPTLGNEDTLQNPPSIGGGPSTLAFVLSHGASMVVSNNAGGVQNSPTLGGYRVNAATAKYSRVVAAKVYGDIARPRGYLFGASGGAYQTVGAAESTSGIWDGFVPMVFGVPNAIPSFMTVQLLALRVLHDKLPQIDDATEPGGSGDPFAGLTSQQRAVLQESARLGFPLRGWWQYATLNGPTR